MGGGGYVAGPVGAAAVARRDPARADRGRQPPRADQPAAGALRAARVCLAFPIPGRTGERYRVTGRPVPPPVDRPSLPRASGSASPRASTCVLVFGGSLGARSINEAAIGGIRRTRRSACSTPAGARDYAALRGARAAGAALRPARVHRRRSARRSLRRDLCVARAGGSIFEIAAHGRPAILVPYPHAAADHQTANARWMADARRGGRRSPTRS